MWHHLLNQLAIFGDIVLCRKKESPKIGDIAFFQKNVPDFRRHSFIRKKTVPENRGQPFSEKPSPIFGDIASFNN